MKRKNEFRKNFSFVCKKNILVIIMILFLCPILGFSYSSFVTNTSSYRSSEMYIGNLLYSISIFEVPTTEYSTITYSLTNEVTLDSNTEKTIYIKVTSLNEVSNKYKLVYETESGINVMYANNENLPTSGLITTDQVSTLLITNTSGSSKTVKFRVVGGYATNDVADITIDSEYSFISSDYHRLDFEVVALYIDGELSTALNNTKLYSLSTTTSNTTGNLISGSTNCTYGATPSYNTNTKTLSISSYDSIIQGNTKCVLYFNELHTLSYNSDGGTSCSDKNIIYGNQYGTLCSPTKNGYSFNGWYNTSGTEVLATTIVSTKADETLTAHWTTNYYTLTYDSNGGTSCTSKSVAYGAQYGTLCTPTKSGYSFTGWFTAASGGTQVSSSTIMGNGATIYAQWRKYTFAEAYSAPAYTMTGSSSSFLQSGSCTSSSSCPTGNCKNAGIVPSGATVYITGVSSLASNEVNAYVATTSFSSMGAGGNNTIAEGNHVCATTYGVPYVASDKVVYDGVTYLYVRLVFNNNGTCIISGYC